MSGAEAVAGLVIGVLPLLISAAEHYNDCFQAFRRYRKFTTEVKEFGQQFKIQKTIFRNQCRLFLEDAIEHDIATKMLDEKDHPYWHDSSLEAELAQQLGGSRDACVAVVKSIMRRLEDIGRESQHLEGIVNQSQETHNEPVRGKAWRHRVGTKLRTCLSNTRFDDHIAALRLLNDDFRNLSGQTRDLAKPRSSTPPTRDIEKFRDIQEASRQVYDALVKACTKHTEHFAHFCIEAKHASSCETSAPQVQFSMALTHLTLTGSATQGDPLWFVIESIIGSATASGRGDLEPQLCNLAKTLKRQLDAPPEPVSKKVKKSVRFQTLAPTARPSIQFVAPVDAATTKSRMRRDLCDHLRSCLKQPARANECLGSLDATGTCKHLLYTPSSAVLPSKPQAVSLDKVISSFASRGSTNGIPQYERLRLAKSLATAVLQYHATPWLKTSWRSDDIFFFGLDEDLVLERASALSKPHLNVKVKGPNGQLSRSSTFPQPSIISNPVLFGLGIVLLEIAFSSTLRSLQQSDDLEDGQETKYTEFFTAKRLVSSIGREMGSTYGTIVKKCLHCDFGCGDDLNDPKLQAGFYRDVVCELDTLEKKFRALQLGDANG